MGERVNSKEDLYSRYGEQFNARLLGQVREDVRRYHGVELDPRVEHAVKTVLRHKYAPPTPFSSIYRDRIVPLNPEVVWEKMEEEGYIGERRISEQNEHFYFRTFEQYGATLSQPSLVAYMTQLVLPEEGVVDTSALDIGCGMGYQTAILKASGISKVTGIEIKPDLAQKARESFQGDDSVTILCQDGKQGIPEQTFDSIVVAAQTGDPTTINTLANQLKLGGKLVIPVDARLLQSELPELYVQIRSNRLLPLDGVLTHVVRNEDGFLLQAGTFVSFVRLL